MAIQGTDQPRSELLTGLRVGHLTATELHGLSVGAIALVERAEQLDHLNQLSAEEVLEIARDALAGIRIAIRIQELDEKALPRESDELAKLIAKHTPAELRDSDPVLHYLDEFNQTHPSSSQLNSELSVQVHNLARALSRMAIGLVHSEEAGGTPASNLQDNARRVLTELVEHGGVYHEKHFDVSRLRRQCELQRFVLQKLGHQ